MNLCHKFIFSLLVYYGLNCTSFAIKKDHSSYKFLSTSFFEGRIKDLANIGLDFLLKVK